MKILFYKMKKILHKDFHIILFIYTKMGNKLYPSSSKKTLNEPTVCKKPIEKQSYIEIPMATEIQIAT